MYYPCALARAPVASPQLGAYILFKLKLAHIRYVEVPVDGVL